MTDVGVESVTAVRVVVLVGDTMVTLPTLVVDFLEATVLSSLSPRRNTCRSAAGGEGTFALFLLLLVIVPVINSHDQKQNNRNACDC